MPQNGMSVNREQGLRSGSHELESFLKRHHELFLVRFITSAAQQHNFLVTATSHGLQGDNDGDIFSETILSEVDLAVFGGNITL